MAPSVRQWRQELKMSFRLGLTLRHAQQKSTHSSRGPKQRQDSYPEPEHRILQASGHSPSAEYRRYVEVTDPGKPFVCRALHG